MVTKNEIIQWASRHGYERDNYGHYQKVQDTPETGTRLRLVLKDKCIRMERQIRIGGKNEWQRYRSGYYGKMHIEPGGKLAGTER